MVVWQGGIDNRIHADYWELGYKKRIIRYEQLYLIATHIPFSYVREKKSIKKFQDRRQLWLELRKKTE
jgi:hypothetical protein